MKLYPAIDLKDGVCVRLLRGEMTTATSFNDDPADQALRFSAMGFEYLHVVDLNGAFEGASVNHNAVASILDATRSPVQLGGGIRDLPSIERWLDAGIARVILGTAAVRDPQLVKDAARAFPGQVAVGIDARDGRVAVQGWAETTDMMAIDLARGLRRMRRCRPDRHRHQPRRAQDRCQRRADRRDGGRGLDSGDRLGRRQECR